MRKYKIIVLALIAMPIFFILTLNITPKLESWFSILDYNQNFYKTAPNNGTPDTFSSPYNSKVRVLAQSEFSVVIKPLYFRVKWAVPELRVGAPGTNDDATFYLAIYSSVEDGAPPVYVSDKLYATAENGTYTADIPISGVTLGKTYDIMFKGHQSLSKKLNDVQISSNTTVLNFSTLDNSSAKGPEVLLGGDISNSGVTPKSLGDDVVNSVDISVLLDDLDLGDASGNFVRSNINQDTSVNSVDFSIILKNLDKIGDQS